MIESEHGHNPDGLNTDEPAIKILTYSFVKKKNCASIQDKEFKAQVTANNLKPVKKEHTCSRMKAIFSVLAMAPKVSTCDFNHQKHKSLEMERKK